MSLSSKIITFKYNQQDATLYNTLCYCQWSTCFRRFSAHHQELKNCTHRIGYMPSLLAATASVGELEQRPPVHLHTRSAFIINIPPHSTAYNVHGVNEHNNRDQVNAGTFSKKSCNVFLRHKYLIRHNRSILHYATDEASSKIR